MIVRCEGTVEWTAERDPASGRWVGVCDELNLATEADTWRDLQVEVSEAMTLFLRDLLQHGELRRFLLEHDWECDIVPDDVPPQDVVFDVPAWMIPSRHKAGARECI